MTSAVLGTKIGTRTQLGTTFLDGLAAGTYVASPALDLHNITSAGVAPRQVSVEVEINPGALGGDNVIMVFCKTSMDGTNYSTGPESGTTRTDEPQLIEIGAVRITTPSIISRTFISGLFDFFGFTPWSVKFILFNKMPNDLAGFGNKLFYTILPGDST